METILPKEISWQAFNGRVLQEASDPSVPIIERVRFLGIYSSNQDEFFKVRVADLKRRLIISKEKGDYNEVSKLLKKIQNTASEYQKILNKIFQDLFEELESYNIYLKDEKELNEAQIKWVKKYFKHHVLKHINPIIINDNIDLVSFLKDQYTYLMIRMTSKNNEHLALIEIPSDVVPRIIRMPSDDDKITLIFLDNVIRIGLDTIFKGLFDYTDIEAYSIKMNRDADYDLANAVDKGVLESMSDSIKQRLNAKPVRFAYDRNMPKQLVAFLAGKLKMSEEDSLMPGNRYHNFKDLLSFPSIGGENFENPSLPLVQSSQFDTAITPFDAISKKDILLYYPYYSFDYFTEFLRHASYDPKVKSIKINIYRVATNSLVIDSLIDAANNGKSVTVVVELKARFDEANNIKWASRLTDAGVKVLFGLPTLKIHSKLCLIIRKENDKIVRYAHIGTGNFNEKTAKIYTDFSLFTTHEEITKEVDSVFDFIEYPYTRPNYKNLLVSPINARNRIYAMIDREIENSTTGFPAYIYLKVNNLVDNGLIERLYKASQAGVKIRCIIRGMCSLKAGIKGLSENIYITSIVDRFLEHPRLMVFCNNNDPALYITSADWMTRNLDHRIEVGAPILDQDLKERIINIFRIQASDNQKARIIDAEQTNEYVQVTEGEPLVRSQIAISQYLFDLEKNILDNIKNKALSEKEITKDKKESKAQNKDLSRKKIKTKN